MTFIYDTRLTPQFSDSACRVLEYMTRSFFTVYCDILFEAVLKINFSYHLGYTLLTHVYYMFVLNIL